MQHRLDIGMRNYLTLWIHCGLIADIQFFHRCKIDGFFANAAFGDSSIA
jgi:hypothetical protein